MKMLHGSGIDIGPLTVRLITAVMVHGIGGGDGGAGGGGGTGGGGGAQPMSLIGQSQGVPGIMRRSGRPAIGAPASDAMTPVKLDVPIPPSPV